MKGVRELVDALGGVPVVANDSESEDEVDDSAEVPVFYTATQQPVTASSTEVHTLSEGTSELEPLRGNCYEWASSNGDKTSTADDVASTGFEGAESDSVHISDPVLKKKEEVQHTAVDEQSGPLDLSALDLVGLDGLLYRLECTAGTADE